MNGCFVSFSQFYGKISVSFFWNLFFSLGTSYKELIWCINYSNVHVHNFRKHWVSLEGDFSLWVSLINYCLEKEIFPTKLKILDVSPIFQKNKNFDKKNHRPISNLPHLSKVCEKIIYRQIDKFMSPKFSPILCGFMKNYNSEYSAFEMIEILKEHLDKSRRHSRQSTSVYSWEN